MDEEAAVAMVRAVYARATGSEDMMSAKGFGALSRDQRTQIASAGGKAAHAQGTAHEWSLEEARDAGILGGKTTSANREHVSLFAAPDEARAMEHAMAAFDDAAHEALVADRAEALAQTKAQALVYAVEEGDRELVRAILATLLAGDVDHVYRVFACTDGAAWLWMNGNAKVRSSELRDEAIRVLERGGFEVERRGCWDIGVRRQG